MNDNTIKALTLYLERTYTNAGPLGKQVHGKWYPTPDEEAPCCNSIRSPSHKWPWSLWKHCHSMEHCAQRFNADPAEIRDTLKKKNLPLLIGLDLPATVRDRVADVLAGTRKTLSSAKKDGFQ